MERGQNIIKNMRSLEYETRNRNMRAGSTMDNYPKIEDTSPDFRFSRKSSMLEKNTKSLAR
jgi:hypothetical protein